jgi:hypothetical protein
MDAIRSVITAGAPSSPLPTSMPPPSGFYVAMVLTLMALSSDRRFDYRSKIEDPRWRTMEWCLFSGGVPHLLWCAR